MERRRSGLGRCSMLPISVGLPLILSGKKRPQRRRLEPEPARPRGGSAPAGFAGRAVVDPALPAHSQGPAVGTTRFPRERLRAAACRTRRERRAVDERRTASRPRPAPLRPARPRGPSFLTRQIVRRRDLGCAGAGRLVRGLRVRPRHVAASGALPPRALRAGGSAPYPNKAETQEGNNFGLGTRLKCARLSGGVRARCLCPCPGAGPPPAPPPPGVPQRSAAARGVVGSGGPGPAHSSARRGRREAGEGAARVAPRTLNL